MSQLLHFRKKYPFVGCALVALFIMVQCGPSGGNREGTQSVTAPQPAIGPTPTMLSSPQDVAVGPDGLYIADTGNHRILKIDANGIISTVAGTGVEGAVLATDGNPKLSQLNSPKGIYARAGKLFIADTLNHRILKIENGKISSIAGFGGVSGIYSQYLSSPEDIFYSDALGLIIADTGNNQVKKLTSTGTLLVLAGTGDPSQLWQAAGQATAIRLFAPRDVSVSPGGNYVYIAGGYGIRLVNTQTGWSEMIAGTGNLGFSDGNGTAQQAQFNITNGVVLDLADQSFDFVASYYIADMANHRIRKVVRGIISTVAGTGTAGFLGEGQPASTAQLNAPSGLVRDDQGNLFIADTGNHRIRKIDANGIISTVAGTGVAGK